MKKEIVARLVKSFEEATRKEQAVEYWMARDIQELLDYDRWENFLNVLEKAKIACQNSKLRVADHFRDVTKMIDVGKGAQRPVADVMLSRFACYLIAQNGDPRKDAIAFAQTYFALQTRKQEILEKRLDEVERLNARKKLAQTEKELSTALYEHGVDDQGFARIRSKGDEALFGGLTTGQMKKKLRVPENRPLADFLPEITIKAKDFAAGITHFNTKKEGLHGELEITDEHVKNNKDVREVLAKNSIYPEQLPPEEDVKKLERRLKTQELKNQAKPGILP